MNIPPFLLPLLLQFIFFFTKINSQHPSENTIPSSGHDSVTNFQPSLPVVIAMLGLMFSLTFVLLLYAKLCHRSSSASSTTSHHIHDGLARSRGAAPPSGVDKSVVESLPFFRFSSLRGSKQGLECAVCLARFEDVEIMRLLPKCKHAFHIDCIDLWLEKHATCPLCRQAVAAADVSEMSRSGSWRFLWEEESNNMELHIEREESRHGSSRFSICSSFRKIENEEEIPIPKNMDSMDGHDHSQSQSLHRFNHRIVVADVALKSRWSSVTSSDLIFLSSEIINKESTRSFSNVDSIKLECGSGSEGRVDPNEKRSVSEIVVHPRFSELDGKEERMRRLWLPIATKTVDWFWNRQSQPQGLHLQTSNV